MPPHFFGWVGTVEQKRRSMSTYSRAVRRTAIALILTIGVLAPDLQSQEAQTLSYGTPEDVGMSAAVLSGALGVYEEAIERGELVGVVVLVARRGRIVLHEALGWRDKEQGLPMERNTLFRMASNTKPLVATGIAKLIEQGRLEYTDLVRTHIPEWDNYRAGFITVGQLLSHSSGLRISSLFLQPLAANTTLQKEAARFGSVGASVPPGETYSYSNPGYNTLAALVEIGSGQLLEDYLKDIAYRPLGMADSYNHQAGHKLDGKLNRMGAVYYERGSNGEWEPGGTPGGPVAYPFARGSGGMISTTWDYAVFCQMFLNGGIYNGVRILEPETVELMTSPEIQVSGGGGYGYGWRITDGIYGHGGSDGTNAWVDPERGIIGLVFTQTPSGRVSLDRFRQLVNLSIEER
jgi:CubicO group peptidase (beta-lactamase class C family)